MAQATTLTVKMPDAAKQDAGSKVRITGTLTRSGQPITNHWVALSDFRMSDCDTGCRQASLGLGSGQVEQCGALGGDCADLVDKRLGGHLLCGSCDVLGQPLRTRLPDRIQDHRPLGTQAGSAVVSTASQPPFPLHGQSARLLRRRARSPEGPH